MPRQLWLCTSEVITWTPRSLFDLLNCSHLLLTIRECQVHDLLTCLNSLHSWIECIIRLVEADVYFILSDLFYLTWTSLLVLARNCNDLLEPALVLDWWLSIVSSSYLIHEHAGDTQNSSVNLSLRTGKGLAEGLVSHGLYLFHRLECVRQLLAWVYSSITKLAVLTSGPGWGVETVEGDGWQVWFYGLTFVILTECQLNWKS